MGKQRTEFFRKCIIIFMILMLMISIGIACLATSGVINYGQSSDVPILINILFGLIIANIVILIILYYFWSILKTLEEIRDRNYSISIEKNKKEEE